MVPSPARLPHHIIEAACRCVTYSDPYGLCIDGVTTALCIEGAIVVATAVAGATATYVATHPEAAAAAARTLSDATTVASDAWSGFKRRLIIGGALIGGALIGQGKDVAKVVKDVIRTEQAAEEKRKKDKEEQGRKKREGGGQGDPPDEDPATE